MIQSHYMLNWLSWALSDVHANSNRPNRLSDLPVVGHWLHRFSKAPLWKEIVEAIERRTKAGQSWYCCCCCWWWDGDCWAHHKSCSMRKTWKTPVWWILVHSRWSQFWSSYSSSNYNGKRHKVKKRRQKSISSRQSISTQIRHTIDYM